VRAQAVQDRPRSAHRRRSKRHQLLGTHALKSKVVAHPFKSKVLAFLHTH
jgi:hypothetical protein